MTEPGATHRQHHDGRDHDQHQRQRHCRIGVGLANDGMAEAESIYEVVGACYNLRMEYGHKKWLHKALLAYRRKILKQSPDEASMAVDTMIAAARERYKSLNDDEKEHAFNTNFRAVIRRLDDAKKSMSRDLEMLEFFYI